MNRLLIGVIILFGTTVATAAPDTQPTTRPSDGKPDTVLGGQYKFTDPPPGWVISKRADDQSVLFISQDETGAVQIAFEPKELSIDGDITATVAGQFIKSIKETRAKNKTVVVMPAKLEKDKRFQIKIHDKFKVGDKTEDELHLFKSIGPRVVEVTISSLSDDQAATDAVFQAGEDLLAGMKFDRKAFKKSK